MASKLVLAVLGLNLVKLAVGVLSVGAPVIKLETSALRGNANMNSLTAFDSKGLSPMELEEMGSAIEELVTKGDDKASQAAVKTMSDFVVKVMIPNRMQSQKADQTLLQSKFKAWEGCNLDKRVQDDMNLAEKIKRAKDHQARYTKRKAEHASCLEVGKGVRLLRDAYCTSVEDVKKVCENAATRVQDKKCCDAQTRTEQQDAKCEGFKNDILYAEKQHEIIMNKVCADYDACYETNSKAYTVFEKMVKADEKTRSWPELLRVKCLVEHFKDGKVSKEAARDCKDHKYKFAKIDYRAAPSKVKCIAAAK